MQDSPCGKMVMKYVLQVQGKVGGWFTDYEGESLADVVSYWDDNKADYVGVNVRIVKIETVVKVTVLVDALIGL